MVFIAFLSQMVRIGDDICNLTGTEPCEKLSRAAKDKRILDFDRLPEAPRSDARV
jgi:hypothetical protein